MELPGLPESLYCRGVQHFFFFRQLEDWETESRRDVGWQFGLTSMFYNDQLVHSDTLIGA